MGITREEQQAYGRLGVAIRETRRLARKCDLDPDDVIYCKKVDGEKRWFPGKLLLENELPPLPAAEQAALDEWREEMKWQDLIEGYAKQTGRSREDIVAEVIAIAEAKMAQEVKEIMDL